MLLKVLGWTNKNTRNECHASVINYEILSDIMRIYVSYLTYAFKYIELFYTVLYKKAIVDTHYLEYSNFVQ